MGGEDYYAPYMHLYIVPIFLVEHRKEREGSREREKLHTHTPQDLFIQGGGRERENVQNYSPRHFFVQGEMRE